MNKIQTETHFCERCGEQLNEDRIVWLELSNHQNRYTDPAKGVLSEEESQGCFPFGKACADAVLKANGRNNKISGNA